MEIENSNLFWLILFRDIEFALLHWLSIVRCKNIIELLKRTLIVLILDLLVMFGLRDNVLENALCIVKNSFRYHSHWRFDGRWMHSVHFIIHHSANSRLLQ